ncbi:tetratricopeptide repeat protein [candidate division WOR-3 bacterium]|nr:tetratricopeptide repeat protein [candidate division WOR-3 bacterium]
MVTVRVLLLLGTAAALIAQPRPPDSTSDISQLTSDIARSSVSAHALGDSLFRHGLYAEAAGEYRRCLLGVAQPAAPDTAWLRLGLSLAASGSLTDAADALHRAADLNPELARPALLALSGFYVRAGSPGQARLELSDLLLFTGDSAARAGLHQARAWLSLQERDLDAAQADLRLAGHATAAGALASGPGHGRCSPTLATVLSSFIPGTGEIYSGRPVAGLLSLLVTGSTGFATYWSVRSGDWVTGVVLFSTLFLRFYNGSRRNAAEFAAEHNARILRNCADSLSLEYRLAPDWFEGVRWLTGPDYPPGAETESLPTR